MVLVIQDTQEKKESVFRPRESRATARNPSFAPDGSRVVFSLSDIGGHQIASVNLQGQDLKRSDRGSRHERLAGVFARRPEDRVRVEPEPATSKST